MSCKVICQVECAFCTAAVQATGHIRLCATGVEIDPDLPNDWRSEAGRGGYGYGPNPEADYYCPLHIPAYLQDIE